MPTKQERIEAVNRLIGEIASCGHHFFRHGDKVARMEVDARGKVWLIDEYSGRRIYTHYAGRWRGFTHGGTLRDLVCSLRDFITSGALLHAHSFGPFPDWYSRGDPWAYGADMVRVREAAKAAGLLQPPAEVS